MGKQVLAKMLPCPSWSRVPSMLARGPTKANQKQPRITTETLAKPVCALHGTLQIMCIDLSENMSATFVPSGDAPWFIRSNDRLPFVPRSGQQSSRSPLEASGLLLPTVKVGFLQIELRDWWPPSSGTVLQQVFTEIPLLTLEHNISLGEPKVGGSLWLFSWIARQSCFSCELARSSRPLEGSFGLWVFWQVAFDSWTTLLNFELPPSLRNWIRLVKGQRWQHGSYKEKLLFLEA